MAAIGELVRSTSGQWMARPPLRCPHGHPLRPGRMLVGSVACSCGRHLTGCCECGAVTYGPALAEGCSLLDATGPHGCGSARGLSRMAGRFLGELHARGEAELGVDVGEVGLHGAR
jgi:hypothetical protein